MLLNANKTVFRPTLTEDMPRRPLIERIPKLSHMVCAAEYDPGMQQLSDYGVQQAEAARATLLAAGVREDAIILRGLVTAHARPGIRAAAQTAGRIYNGSFGQLVESDVISRVSHNPTAIRSLDNLIDYALRREGIAAGRQVVLVAEQTFMQPVRHSAESLGIFPRPTPLKEGEMPPPRHIPGTSEDIFAGEVLAYDSSDWPQRDFFSPLAAVNLGPHFSGVYPSEYGAMVSAAKDSPVSEFPTSIQRNQLRSGGHFPQQHFEILTTPQLPPPHPLAGIGF